MTVAETAAQEPRSIIGQAYAFAKKAHEGQERKSGAPYFTHVLAAAETLREWNLDEMTIAAGLLHDILEDTKHARQELVERFGEEVAFLVEGVTKLRQFSFRTVPQETQVENFRKLIIALSEDVRVILIKLADRLHNMRTLDALPHEKQKRIALETDEIYAPIAYRLGMHELSGELHDLAFPYLHPKEDAWLKSILPEAYEARRTYLESLKPLVAEALEQHHIRTISIDFRAKRTSSLYEKLARKSHMDIEQIYDLVAMRVIVPTTDACYATLGVIHELWRPLPGGMEDYIAVPKPNGYRSLHTTVVGPGGKIVEFQIRTKEMHEENEYGIAAHWIYQQARKGAAPSARKLTEELQWVQQLQNWQSHNGTETTTPDEFLETMKIDFFKNRIFVLTPKGDVIDLPAGATPVDFAYAIHSEVGDSCSGAKINKQIVPLNQMLRSGDLIEILTQKKKKPSEDWLNFVKTTNAREHIKAASRGRSMGMLATPKPSQIEFKIIAHNRIGLLKDVSSIISRSHVNIASVEVRTPAGSNYPTIAITCDLQSREKAERLALKVKQLKEVREVSYRIV